MTYQCAICKLEYTDQETARKCAAWCGTHSSCNFLIAKQAVNKKAAKDMPAESDDRFNK